MINYRNITKTTETDLRLPNEPFDLFGRLLVTHADNQWSYETKLFEYVKQQVFPNEAYTFEEVDRKGFAIGAYADETCVGLAIFEYDWNKYLYLMDLKVNGEYRKRGIAKELINQGQAQAKKLNYKGISTIAQNNNLAACKFYLQNGFVIGGYNSMDYRHTSQQDKADVYFYLDFQ